MKYIDKVNVNDNVKDLPLQQGQGHELSLVSSFV